MSDYTYPDEYIRKAESRIRKQVDGNGLDPKTISLAIKRQGEEILSAQSWFTVDVTVNQSSSKGKNSKGTVIESGQSRTHIDQYMLDFEQGDSIRQIAKKEILNLPLKGFGAENVVIPLKGQSTIFTEYATCGRCGGQGQSSCQPCHGRGRAQCQLCYARGMIQCLYCHGRGQVQEGETMKFCNNCQGKGENFCTQCHGQREVPCGICHSKGRVSCTDCNAEGVNSTHYSVEPTLKIAAAIHVQDLDQEPKTFVSKVGADKLARGGHIDVNQVKAPEPEESEKPSEISYYQDDELPASDAQNKIYYEAKIPWAVAEVEVNAKAYNVAFIGTKGAVADSGHFMDDLWDRPAKLLSDGAKGNGNVAGLLKDACKMRVSRETLELVIKGSRKKAMTKLSQNYRIGVTQGFLKQFVQNAYLSLKRVTRRPRYIGLGAGLIIAAAIYNYWFMMDGRDVTSTNSQNIRYMIDGIPLMIGLLITLFTTKGAGFITYQSLMKDIGIKSIKLPPAGKAALYGVVGNLLLWGGFIGFLLIH